MNAPIGSGFRADWNASVQWDGEYMTLSAYLNNPRLTIYRLDVSADDATVVSATHLDLPKRNLDEGQSWIHAGAVIGSEWNNTNSKVAFWAYPKGGNERTSIALSCSTRYGGDEAARAPASCLQSEYIALSPSAILHFSS